MQRDGHEGRGAEGGGGRAGGDDGGAAAGGGGSAADVVEVAIDVGARPATVWRCITESSLLSRWLAAGVTMDARVGGAVRIDFARYGTVVTGVVEELRPYAALAFSWGVAEGPQKDALPAGSTRVRIVLAPTIDGTRVTLRHEGLPTEKERRDHAFGWTGYLGSLAGTAPLASIGSADAALATPEALWDAWFSAWGETDAARRDALLARCLSETGAFADIHCAVRGRAAVSAWMAQCQAMFPGVRVERDGPSLSSRDALLVRWRCPAPDGSVFARGVNFARLDPDGRLAEVRAFWEG